MKSSSLVLLITLLLLIVALFFSNVLLRKEYEKIDKSDSYWTYGKILEQPFRHLKIEGGNITNIVFEPSQNSSVRVIKNWWAYINNTVKAVVKNDTLFLIVPNSYKDINEKRYMGWITPVRLFSPELLSVNGFDTNFKLSKLKQRNLSIHLAGKSTLEVESYLHNFDSLNITQSDSSIVRIEMSPDLAASRKPAIDSTSTNGPIPGPTAFSNIRVAAASGERNRFYSWQTMFVKSLEANLTGPSLLDVGRAHPRSLKLDVSDSSRIIISGGTLSKFRSGAKAE
ncbi:MAG TPA: hypothetical protein VEZ17_00460 [Chitinophagaceae bacterium]|jgi:hypothetical protein|nr:hypothetical protein [Chitinophagaceae bacterium]